jgi:hypothetical protein
LEFNEIELVIHSTSVEVWYRCQRYLTLAVTRDRQLVVNLNPLRREDIQLTDDYTSLANASKLDIFTLIQGENNHMALPAMKKEPARTRAIRSQRTTRNNSSSVTVEHMSESVRDKVLNALLDSLLAHPDQSTSFRAAETRRIAEKFGEPLYAVAGVRANYTRGSYGTPAKLLDERRRARKARASR